MSGLPLGLRAVGRLEVSGDLKAGQKVTKIALRRGPVIHHKKERTIQPLKDEVEDGVSLGGGIKLYSRWVTIIPFVVIPEEPHSVTLFGRFRSANGFLTEGK